MPQPPLGLSFTDQASDSHCGASQSAGIVENLPSAAKNVSVGNAARNGLFSALLAAEGYSASPRAFGRRKLALEPVPLGAKLIDLAQHPLQQSIG
jgi:hypothetical protein